MGIFHSFSFAVFLLLLFFFFLHSIPYSFQQGIYQILVILIFPLVPLLSLNKMNKDHELEKIAGEMSHNSTKEIQRKQIYMMFLIFIECVHQCFSYSKYLGQCYLICPNIPSIKYTLEIGISLQCNELTWYYNTLYFVFQNSTHFFKLYLMAIAIKANLSYNTQKLEEKL